MTVTSDRTKQTKYLRAELKKAEEMAISWTKRRNDLLERLCAQLCPIQPGDRIEQVPGVRGIWELTNRLIWKPCEVRMLEKVRLYNFAVAFNRNPLFAVVLDPSYGGALYSGEVTLTLNQLKRCFKKVEP